MTQEIFGPVVAVLEVADYEAGLAASNDSRYGLKSALDFFTWGKTWETWAGTTR